MSDNKPMTVGDLIKELQKYPSEIGFYFRNPPSGRYLGLDSDFKRSYIEKFHSDVLIIEVDSD